MHSLCRFSCLSEFPTGGKICSWLQKIECSWNFEFSRNRSGTSLWASRKLLEFSGHIRDTPCSIGRSLRKSKTSDFRPTWHRKIEILWIFEFHRNQVRLSLRTSGKISGRHRAVGRRVFTWQTLLWIKNFGFPTRFSSKFRFVCARIHVHSHRLV